MDFSLSDDQVQLGDAVKRFCDGEYPRETRGDAASAERREQRWAMMAELGLTALGIAEEQGGMGQGMVEQMIVLEALGRALSPEPYLSTAVIGAGLLEALGSSAQCNDWLGAVAEGRSRLALALYEPGERYATAAASCQAVRSGDDWVLNGHKSLVLDGESADLLLIVAQCADGQGLFLVPRQSPGLALQTGTALDGRELAQLTLNDLRLPASARLGSAEATAAALDSALDRANAALCAEAVGAMAELVEQTAEFLKVRKQFGAPLAKFQALQHRIVDLLIALEQARSMAAVAAMAVDEGEPAQRRKLVAAAKVQVCRAARQIGKEAVQMHGAMGMTAECRVGHYVKRLMVTEQLFGDAHHQLQRFMD